MTDEELQILLLGGESDRAERKASPTDGDKIRQAICAFANDLPKSDKPGVVFVGVNDDGTCAHLPIDDRLLQTLGAMRSDGNITPFPVMMVQKRSVAGCEMAVIIVSPSDSPPVRFKGRVWIRTGPRRDIAGPEEERRLGEKRRSRDLPFDIRPLDGLSLGDLDVDLFSQAYLPNAIAPDVLEQNRRTVEDQLRSLRFLTFEGVPTVLANLVIGRDPLRALPGAYVQFLRLSGVDLTDPIKDRKEISGPLMGMIGQLDEVVLAHVSTALDVAKTGSEIKHPDYPVAAIQQIARNAILHRTYEGTNAPIRVTWFDDRIEIQSPGGPFGQVNKSNFGRLGVTDYRNPHLAEAMKNLGYVQRFGYGIALARKEMEKNGNPPLEFVVEDEHLLCVLRRRA